MYTFHHHNGIVDHNCNGKHHGRKCQQVHTKSNQFQNEEGSNQSHRNGNSRNQCRTEILQEHIYYDKHQNKGLYQRLDNLMNRSEQEVVGILCNIDFQTSRQCFLSLFQSSLQIRDSLCCICSSHLIHNTSNRFMPVNPVIEGISQTAQFNVCNFAQSKNLTIRQSLYYDIFKLLNLLQTSFIANGVLISLISSFTKLPRSSFNILFCQCIRHISRIQFVLSHNIRL